MRFLFLNGVRIKRDAVGVVPYGDAWVLCEQGGTRGARFFRTPQVCQPSPVGEKKSPFGRLLSGDRMLADGGWGVVSPSSKKETSVEVSSWKILLQ
jgi:hypothetical protein